MNPPSDLTEMRSQGSYEEQLSIDLWHQSILMGECLSKEGGKDPLWTLVAKQGSEEQDGRSSVRRYFVFVDFFKMKGSTACLYSDLNHQEKRE